MHVVRTLQLEEGMITALPIKTQDGQLVADAGAAIDQHIIAQLNSYGIPEVQIQDDEPAEAPAPEVKQSATEPAPAKGGNVQNPTYSQRIKSSPTFQRFQFNYTKGISDLAKELSPIVNQSGPFDKHALCELAFSLIDGVRSVELFDMLHNMRSVDDSIYAHSMNVGLIAGILGKWLKLPREEIQLLVMAGLLHDVGKAKIPPEVLNKPGKYTDEEFAMVKSHPQLSYDLLKEYPDSVLDPRVKLAALQHHERLDGSGYPQGLKGDEIDDFAMMIAVADVYDAMTAARSYRAPLCPFQVIAAFEKEGLQKYHPKYILKFLEKIANAYQNNRILLNDGRAGDIIFLNKQLSRPIVKLSDGTCVDLSSTPNLSIQSIL